MAKKKLSLNETKSIVSNKGTPTSKVTKTPVNKTVPRPIHANVSQSIRKMTLADKKKFLELYASGAHHNAYNAYLGLDRSDIEWLVVNLEDIKKEVASKSVRRQQAVRSKRIELEKAKVMQKTGPSTKKWRVSKKDKKLFVHRSNTFSYIKMAEIYNVSTDDILREYKRLFK